jgi:hypothetical protein
MAAALDPLFLFSTTSFTASGGEGKLETLSAFMTITCKKASGKGKTAGNDTATFSGTITYEECAALGSPINSEGDASGVVLQKFTGELCWINEAKLEVGAFIETSEANRVHLLLPFGALDLLWGSQVATVTPVATKTKFGNLSLSGTNGDQAVSSCVGLTGTKTPSLKVIESETGTVKDGTIVARGTLTSEVEGQIDG